MKTIPGVVGRKYEIHLLEQILERDDPQMVAVYGRRRVGKTYLVKRFFDGKFDFAFTGSYRTATSVQLSLFSMALAEYSHCPQRSFANWFEAFNALRDYFKTLKKERILVFIDEIPWLDVPKSDFLAAFSRFWNDWASTAQGVKVIVCGSATTWMLDKFVGDKGGLYGRTNRSIYLAPFTLGETEQFMVSRNMQWSRRQIMEAYMIFGGIPYYLDMLDNTMSPYQNADRLFFMQGAPLKNEYDFLFRTLFGESSCSRNVVEILAKKSKGMTQTEIKDAINKKEGGNLSKVLRNLQKCDFIRVYFSIGKKKRDAMYQLTDLFTLFHIRFVNGMNSQDEHYWSNLSDHVRDSWAGYAFEMVCLHHIPQIKQRLGISGVLTNACSWQTPPLTDGDGTQWSGTQIDLLLERADRTINVCEIKYCRNRYVITESYDRHMRERVETFRHHTRTKSALPVVFITSYGLEKNSYSYGYPLEVSMDDLFG